MTNYTVTIFSFYMYFKTCNIDYFDCSVYKRLRSRGVFGKFKNNQKSQKDIPQSDIVFLPVLQAHHWGLLVFYPKKKIVILLDSLQSAGCINKETAFQRAKRLLTFYFPPSELNWESWNFYMPPADMAVSNFRKWMVLELCSGSLRTNRIKILPEEDIPTRRQKDKVTTRKRPHRSPPPLPKERYLRLASLITEGMFLNSSDSGVDADVSSNTLSSEDSETSFQSQQLTSTPKKTSRTKPKKGSS
ncbi:uncharacterized protein LOC118420125 [Branchiostoma floridae]|uniref:Uncharacterized protein LOC118420125 n=1 Tax=Branchiostoma floridae TaxID=7739 RepID=A0A9J7LHS9_BRAFL|nr:uncharacterized protein LOC118420125 [Branchiostoma floridae]